jgi:hypothetical protein
MKNLRLYWRLPIGLCALLVAGSGQMIHAGEDAFVIAVTGGPGVTFRGSYLVTTSMGESKSNKVESSVPAEFRVVGTAIYLNFQNQAPGGEIEIRIDANGKRSLDKDSAAAKAAQFLEVSISKNGTTIKEQRTDAPHGVVSLASTEPAGGLPRQTEYRVDGSVKFAMLTLTSEAGDIEQELVPIPFTREFFPKEGWAVGLTAQKARVVRPDPFDFNGQRIEVLDDGTSGLLRVAIRVNGGLLGSADTSEPFGVASTTIRIP